MIKFKIEALEKQKPMEVIKSHNAYKCPRCDSVVFPYTFKYCPECGQRIVEEDK